MSWNNLKKWTLATTIALYGTFNLDAKPVEKETIHPTYSYIQEVIDNENDPSKSPIQKDLKEKLRINFDYIPIKLVDKDTLSQEDQKQILKHELAAFKENLNEIWIYKDSSKIYQNSDFQSIESIIAHELGHGWMQRLWRMITETDEKVPYNTINEKCIAEGMAQYFSATYKNLQLEELSARESKNYLLKNNVEETGLNFITQVANKYKNIERTMELLVERYPTFKELYNPQEYISNQEELVRNIE